MTSLPTFTSGTPGKPTRYDLSGATGDLVLRRLHDIVITGQAYEGLMSVLDVPALSSVFADHNAAGDTTYYYTDGIHPNELGTATLAQLYADKINAMGLS